VQVEGVAGALRRNGHRRLHVPVRVNGDGPLRIKTVEVLLGSRVPASCRTRHPLRSRSRIAITED
jgi:hypothetical protein